MAGEPSKDTGFDISSKVENVKITEEEWNGEFADI